MALAALLLAPAATVLAQSFWSGGTSDFNVPASWSGLYLDPSNPNCANDSGIGNVVLIQPGDPVWQHGDTIAGQAGGSAGAYLQTGSTNNTGGGNWMRLAVGTGSVGSYILSNGVVNVGGETHIGEHGTATLEIHGGTYNGGVNGGNPGLCMGDADWSGPSDNPVGTLLMTDGIINTTHEMWFGEANSGRVGTGHFIMHGGIINVNNWFVLGRFGGQGTGIMDGGTINKSANGNVQFGVGTTTTTNGPIGATATFNQSGGTFNCLSEYQIATDNNLTICTNNISGTAVLNVGNWFAVGRFGGMGTLNISGNAAITKSGVTGGNVTIASGTSVGVINQNGGTFTNTATQSWIAESGTGLWNLTNGTVVLGVIHLTQNAGANGTFNLCGGDLTVTEITDNNAAGIGTFNFNGGTLHAGAPAANPWIHNVNGGVNILADGAKIDTAGLDVTINSVLNDSGAGFGLTKTGNGTLTLSGGNNFNSPVIISAGTLATTTASTSVGAISVTDSAGFSVVSTGVGFQFNASSSMTLGTTAGAAVGFDLGGFGNPTVAPLNVGGNMAVNGTTVINVADALPQLGQFPLIKYGTKSGSGTFTVGTLPSGVVATIVNNAANHSIDLNITSVALDLWSGLAGGNWDINVTMNWANAGTGLPTTYLDGVSVVFNDTALGTTTVNLVTNVAPRSVTILNNTSNYTLVGTGRINGTIGLNKGGAAAFAIYNTNGYTGPTVLSGGTLMVSNLANGGVASPIGASSANPTNLVLGGGALSYAGAPLTINRGYNLQYNYNSNGIAINNALDLQADLTLTGPATAAAASSFVKSGPGTLTYAGAVTNVLSGGAFPGYQVLGGTLVFNGSAGAQLNTNVNEFWVGSSTNGPANLILTNTTLNVQSWIALSRGNGTSNYLSTMRMDNSTIHAGNFSMGYWANVAGNFETSTLTMNNSKFYDTGAFNIGESAGSSATIYMNGNSLFNENGPFLCGLQTGATGAVIMADSSIVTNNLWLSVGANGYGSLVMKNNAFLAEGSDFNFGDYGANGTVGEFTIQDNAQVVLTGSGNGVFVGKSAGAIGNVFQTGGTINARSAGVWQLAQASGSQGTWLQSGGTNYAGGWVSIGRGNTVGDTSMTGLMVVSGGLLDQVGIANGLIVGESGNGTLTINNTGLVVSESTNSGVAIGWNAGVGTLNLDGGTLVANFIQGGTAGSSTVNFNGGLLRVGPGARLNFMTNITTAYILAGAVIDTGTNNIDISTSLQNNGPGGLTKSGSGTLLLDGVNSYSGTTTVNAGALGGSGTIAGPVVIAAGAVLSPGNSIGTLTLNSTLNLAGTSETIMEVNKTAMTSDLVTGASSITYGGTLVLKNLSGALQAGDTFTLFTAGAYTGSFSSVISQTPGQTVTWNTSQLPVNGKVSVTTAVAAPVTLAPLVSAGRLNLTWPANQIGWELQHQVNPLTVGISTNWVAVPGSTATNAVSLPLDIVEPTEFFRLVFPQQ